MRPMANEKEKAERKRLRDLARKTLEAYRELNAAAAEASLIGKKGPNGDSMVRAGDILEGVLAEIRGTTKAPA